MYIPKHFEDPRIDVMQALMRDYQRYALLAADSSTAAKQTSLQSGCKATSA